MSEQGDLEKKFARLIAQHIVWITDHPGWEVSLGEGYNAEHVGHMAGSLHYCGVAQDLNLFVGGEWKTEDCPEWQEIGAQWETLDPLARWGGRFAKVDLDHFSLSFEGKS